MAQKLTDTEIKQRLHQRVLATITKLKALLRQKDTLLAEKDAHIVQLETKLLDKESQRKELAGKLFKAKAAITRSGRSCRSTAPQPGGSAWP